jgi:hypothetical protein
MALRKYCVREPNSAPRWAANIVIPIDLGQNITKEISGWRKLNTHAKYDINKKWNIYWSYFVCANQVRAHQENYKSSQNQIAITMSWWGYVFKLRQSAKGLKKR